MIELFPIVSYLCLAAPSIWLPPSTKGNNFPWHFTECGRFQIHVPQWVKWLLQFPLFHLWPLRCSGCFCHRFIMVDNGVDGEGNGTASVLLCHQLIAPPPQNELSVATIILIAAMHTHTSHCLLASFVGWCWWINREEIGEGKGRAHGVSRGKGINECVMVGKGRYECNYGGAGGNQVEKKQCMIGS